MGTPASVIRCCTVLVSFSKQLCARQFGLVLLTEGIQYLQAQTWAARYLKWGVGARPFPSVLHHCTLKIEDPPNFVDITLLCHQKLT